MTSYAAIYQDIEETREKEETIMAISIKKFCLEVSKIHINFHDSNLEVCYEI